MTRSQCGKKTYWLSLRVCRTPVPLFRGGPYHGGACRAGSREHIYIYIYIYVYLYMYGSLEELCTRAVCQGFATSSRPKAPKRPKGKRKTTAIQAGKTKTPRELRQLRKHAANAFCHGGFVMKCHDCVFFCGFFHFLLGLGNDPKTGYDGYDPQKHPPTNQEIQGFPSLGLASMSAVGPNVWRPVGNAENGEVFLGYPRLTHVQHNIWELLHLSGHLVYTYFL